MNSFFDFLGDISGYRPLYLATLTELDDIRLELTEKKRLLKWYSEELKKAKEQIRQLELITPRPAPPELTFFREKPSSWIQEQIDNMGLKIQRLPLDGKYRMTNKSNTMNIIAYDIADQLTYVKNWFDCENFAIWTKAHVDLTFGVNHFGVVLDYKSGHAYNLAIYPDGDISVVDTQYDGVYVWTERPQAFYSLKEAFLLL